MITNAYRILNSLRNDGTKNYTFPEKTIKNYSGEDRTTNNAGYTYVKNAFSGIVSSGVNISSSADNGDFCIGIHIGTGDTAPTPDDYTLESPLTSSSVSRTSDKPNSSALLDEDNNIIGVRRMVTFQNRTSSNIVVKEIGTFWKAYYANISSADLFLIERTVLDEPVTLEPNGTITVAFDQFY